MLGLKLIHVTKSGPMPSGTSKLSKVTDKNVSTSCGTSLKWRHKERDGVENHRRLACLINVCSGTDKKNHQSSASLAFVRGIDRWPMDSPHKGLVTQEMSPFDDVIMIFKLTSHIETQTKLPHFHGRHVQMPFLVWKLLYFDSYSNEICPQLPLVEIMAWCRLVDKPFP